MSSNSVSSSSSLPANNNVITPEQVQQMMAELTRLREVETAGNRELQLARHQLQEAQRVAAAAAAQVANQTRLSIKPPQLKVFKGDAQSTDRQGCKKWLKQLNHQFDMFASEYPVNPPTRRIQVAISYFEGTADLWWTSLSAADRNRHSESWSAFEAALIERFSPVQAAELARARLLSLKQKGSLTAFVDRFQEELLPIQSEMHPHDQVFHFTRGLSDSRVVQKIVESKPQTLIEAINIGITWEAFFASMSNSTTGRTQPTKFNNHFRNPYASSQPSFNNRASSHSSNSVPMEVSAVRGGDASEMFPEDDFASSSQSATSSSSSHAASSEPSLAEVMKKLSVLEKSHLAAMGHNNNGNKSGGRRDNSRVNVPGVTAEQARARRLANLCIRCGGEDHWKNECPQARKSLN